ncbi:MAG TPA: Ig-like domain-containing protein, partial [Ferruginibacter sp.]|nr:Ig-like domain-containing protein [Ferruginibacter sp.]
MKHCYVKKISKIIGLLMVCFGILPSAYSQYFPVRAVNDQQVVIVPGTANGNVTTNDQLFNPGQFTLTQLSSPANGVLTFNTTTGAYSYVPSGLFQGADSWTYQICDGGVDQNLATTADNNCSVGRVVFRNIFNCKNTMFYIPMPENEARDFLEDINVANDDVTRVYVGLSVLGEGYIIYDQWEDGYEVDITNPVQSTTEIWGDGDVSNGVAPGYPTDEIPGGSTIILTNALSSGHDNTTTYNPNAPGADATLQATIDFDGRDKVYASGEASMSKFAWGIVGTLSTSSSAVPPTRDWGTSFVLPVGQNTANAGAQFQISNLSIIAKENNTVVTIDRDANGSVDITVTLNEGETYYVDSRQGATVIPVNEGATINATKDIQVMLMTGDYNSVYAGRTFALNPTATLSNTYFMPGVPQETVRVYLYNPTGSAITVTRTTAGGATVNINVPARSSVFNDVNNSGLGYRYSSATSFSIIATVDYNAVNSDWGFTPIPQTNMSPVALFSFAEGSDPTNAGYGTNNYSKVLITPTCNTYICVDLDGDGNPDKVSFNNDIDVDDGAVTIGGINYDETTSDLGILVNQFQTLTIGGPTGTLNGARVWTKTGANNTGLQGCDIAVVYGQDGGPNGAPNIDAGYTLPKTSIPLQVTTTIPANACPSNNTSFIVPVLLDGVGPFNVLLYNKTTNEVIQFSTNLTTFNINAHNPGNYLLKINDVNCLTFELSFAIAANPNCATYAVNDEHSTFDDVNVSGNVLTNDFDLENHTQNFGSFLDQSTSAVIATGATVSGVDLAGTPVANAGVFTFDANGNYTLDPEPGFIGTVSIPYQVCDNGAPVFCDTAILTITVDPFPGVANSVIANNDENISYGSPVSGNVQVNDKDPQGDSFSVTAVTGSTPGTTFTVSGTSQGSAVSDAGTLVINADGSYIYTPAIGFTGSIDVPYTITDSQGATSIATLHIDVLSDPNGLANDPPFAGDDFEFTSVGVPVTGNFIINDNDPNGNNLSLNGVTIDASGPATPVGAAISTVQGGTIQFYADGTFLYTPPIGYVGPDLVTYQLCDVTAVAPQPLCAEATIHFLMCACGGNSTNAVNDENSTWEDVNVSGNVLNNDFDIENNTQTFGTFLDQTSGIGILTGATLSGIDQTGSPVVNAGVLTFDSNGNYTFDPTPGFLGTVTVPYQVCDNGSPSVCDTANLTIIVSPLPTSGVNSVIANNDENISNGSPVGGNVTSNDHDPQGDAFTVTDVTGSTPGVSFTVAGIDLDGNPVANAGTLVINSNGTYTYTPTIGFYGSINVPYTITDTPGATSTAVLHIDVLQDPNGPANNPPFAGDDFGYTTVNVPVTGSFIDNDNDPNGDDLSYNGVTIVTGGPATAIGAPIATNQGGTIQFYTNGTYLYTPPVNYVGPDFVNYTICDVTTVAIQPLCADAVIHILVGPGINISGNVWDDANGDITDPGAAEPQTNAGGALFVNLVDNLGVVIATTAVANDGTYSFSNVTPNGSYSLVLSVTNGTIGQPAPAESLPAGWVNTGTNLNGTTSATTPGLIDVQSFGFTNTINLDFGIEQIPGTDDHNTPVPQPTVGDFITLDGGGNPPVLSGIDPEDCSTGCTVQGNSVIITTVPANAELYYN